jgi:hypothetical protein
MAIKKQEFYEGAALHLLARGGSIRHIRYVPPFFHINDKFAVLLKYSTRGRSPWGFTFMPDEQALLKRTSVGHAIVIGLVCGSDGVAAISYDELLTIASHRRTSLHIACYRGHHQHYEVNGPDGTLAWKIAPSKWQNILEP